MSQKNNAFDESFYTLANSIAVKIDQNEDGSEQKEQVEKLASLEIKFRESINKYAQSDKIYEKFVFFIVAHNQNILSARPYFRERGPVFSKQITPAIQNANVEKLKEFNINFKFISFVKENWLGPFPKKCEILYQKIETARRILIENNLPLAINEAKKFFRAVPESHVTLMDMITVSVDGLISGIDKHSGKYTKVWRSVCIGRVKGNLVELYSETMVHFYPVEKRILYKANTIRSRKKIEDLDELVKEINKSFQQDKKDGKKNSDIKVTKSQIFELLNAASNYSTDYIINEGSEEEVSFLDTFVHEKNEEEEFALQDTLVKTLEMAKKEDILTRKILSLTGLDI
jgi:hypothetical protein